MTAASNPAPGPVLVALGSDARSLRLVHAGFRMARERGLPWVVAHVEVPGWETADEADQARVWLQEAQELGGEVVWLRGATVVAGLLALARRRAPSLIVMGVTRARGPWDRLESSRAQALLGRNLDVPIVALPLDAAPVPTPAWRRPGELLGTTAAVAVILGLAGLFGATLAQAAGFAALPVTFAVALGFILHRWGRGVAALATGAASIGLARWLVPAVGPDAWPRVLAFAATVAGAQAVVDLVGQLRQETRAGRRREAETVLLMLLGRTLARCTGEAEVADVLVQRLRTLVRGEACLLLPGAGDAWLRLPAGPDPAAPPPSQLLPAFAAAATAGDPLEPLYRPPHAYIPLAGRGGPMGVLQLRAETDARLPQERWGLLQSYAVQAALALERVRALAAAQRVRVENETERMRSALLGAVSHDLRTPLAAIQGAATSLLLPEEALPAEARTDLLTMIRDESVRLSRLLTNLLDLTRLESGVIRAHKEWQPLDEVVGATLERLERQGPVPVEVDLPEDLPLVPLDGGLMEQVLQNLLGNARQHAQDGPVLLRAWAGDGSVELAVCDRGPGVPAEYRSQVFDKFFRLPGQGGDGGVGLGLAICDAIVKAHGGRIWVEDRDGGGAAFRIRLPLDGPPPQVPEPEDAGGAP